MNANANANNSNLGVLYIYIDFLLHDFQKHNCNNVDIIIFIKKIIIKIFFTIKRYYHKMNILLF